MHGLDAIARLADAPGTSAGRRAAFTLAAVGCGLVLICILAVASLDRGSIVGRAARLGPPFAIALATLFLLAWWGGGRLARGLNGPRLRGSVLAAAFAELALLVAALVGGASGLLLEPQPFVFGVGVALIDGIAKPIYWTALFGSLPALALGAAFPRTARHFLGRRGRR